MANNIRFSHLNPVNFYEMNPQVISQYVSRDIDTNPYIDTLEQWQSKRPYLQPWQLNDTVRLQFESDYAPVKIKVIDGYERIYDTIALTQMALNVNDPNFHIYECAIALTPYDPGNYFFLLEVGLDSDNKPLQTFISEPQNFSTRQKESLLLEYKHYQFKGNTIFETGFAPNIRFKGRLSLKSPSAKDTFFEDEHLSQRLGDGRPFEVWELNIGGTTGVPDWMAKKINRILTCSHTLFDGKQFTKAGEAMQPVSEKLYPMRSWLMDMRDTANKDGVTYTNNQVNLGPESFVISVDSKGFSLSATGEEQILDVQ